MIKHGRQTRSDDCDAIASSLTDVVKSYESGETKRWRQHRGCFNICAVTIMVSTSSFVAKDATVATRHIALLRALATITLSPATATPLSPLMVVGYAVTAENNPHSTALCQARVGPYSSVLAHSSSCVNARSWWCPCCHQRPQRTFGLGGPGNCTDTCGALAKFPDRRVQPVWRLPSLSPIRGQFFSERDPLVRQAPAIERFTSVGSPFMPLHGRDSPPWY